MLRPYVGVEAGVIWQKYTCKIRSILTVCELTKLPCADCGLCYTVCQLTQRKYHFQGAKLAKYAKFHKLCDMLFVIFTIVWFITRIVLYPLR